MPKNIILSIVVPTHNRSQYAIKCIEAVLSIKRQDIEIVVSDTSTDFFLENLLKTNNELFLADSRLVYRKINEPSNLTKNNNEAVSMARGEYVCLIGDDDCISDVAIDAAIWAHQRNVDVVSQTVSCNYAWPDFRSRLARKGHAGKLYVPRQLRQPKIRNASVDLEMALSNAFQGTDQLPRCYHGIVRRSVLDRIRALTGAYFHGSSPDMSGAVSIACLIDSYYEVDIPLTIPGASAGSNSGRSAMNTHKGSLSSETQTSSFQDADWSEGVPKFFSVETVWAHAGLQSLKKLKPELAEGYNYARLLALCETRHREYAKCTATAEAEVKVLLPDSADTLSARIKTEKAAEWRRHMWHYLKRGLVPTASGGRKNFRNLSDIAEASDALRYYLLKSGMNFAAHASTLN